MRALGRVVTISLIAAASSAIVASAPAGARDDLRINQIQILGTHNSFHGRPARAITPGEGADYEHPRLTTQLERQGIRNLELDAYNDGADLPVFHSLIVDTESQCPNLTECLGEIGRWSAAHRRHVPLVLFIETKPLPTNPNPPFQLAIDADASRRGLSEWDRAGLDRIDRIVRDAFGKRLLTADEVRGKRKTLRDAVERDGWPSLSTARGRVMVILNVGGTHALQDTYLKGHPSLRGRAMFVPSAPGDDFAAFVKRDVPNAAEIERLVRRNFIVSTRADANGEQARANDHRRADTALRSGAQVVVTDYPVPDPATGTTYSVALPGGRPARCNPVTAPPSCRDKRLEPGR